MLMKKVAAKFWGGFVMFLLLGSLWPAFVCASQGLSIVEKHTTQDEVILYVDGLEEPVQDVTYQIGTMACIVHGTELVKDMGDPIYTLILWDNSLSVMEKEGQRIKEILTDLIANRVKEEQFAIAVLDKELSCLAGYSNNYAELKQMIQSIEGEDKDASVVNNLYEAIQAFNQIQDAGYKRIVLITDGADTADTGYSWDELYDLLEETPYPIHIIAIMKEGDQEEIQNIFALSRTTAASSFLLEEETDELSIVQGLSVDYGILQIKVQIPEEIQDGSTQNSQLTLRTGTDSYTVQTQINLPFLKIGEKQKEFPGESGEELTEGTGEQENMEDEPGQVIMRSGKIFSPGIIIVLAAGIVMVIGIVFFCIYRRRKEKPGSRDVYEELDEGIGNKRYVEGGIRKEQVVTRGKEKTERYGEYGRSAENPLDIKNTICIFGTSSEDKNDTKYVEPSHVVKFTNVENLVQMYQCGIMDKVLVGRDPTSCAIAITTDDAVSSKHCEISFIDGQYYVEDMDSSNGTYVNGYRISAKEEIKAGDKIKIGKWEYFFTAE